MRSRQVSPALLRPIAGSTAALRDVIGDGGAGGARALKAAERPFATAVLQINSGRQCT